MVTIYIYQRLYIVVLSFLDLRRNVGSNDLQENKTDMWLGVNIRSAGAGKPVVVMRRFSSSSFASSFDM